MRVGLLIVLFAASNLVRADAFLVENQNPFVNVFGLAKNHGARLTKPNQVVMGLTYSVASNFEIGDNAGEQIVIDGEQEKTTLGVKWGVNERWELGIEVPLVRHSGGYLDNLIIDWHDWFDLPQNGRDLASNDQLLFAYQGGAPSYRLESDATELGNVVILASRAVGSADTLAQALRLHVKLPTGDDETLAGSGGFDAGVAYYVTKPLTSGFEAGGWLGATYLSDSDVLNGLSRSFVAQGGVHVGYQVSDAVSLVVQWDIHSQVYERTRLRQLNEIAYLLSFGATVDLSEGHSLDLVVVENFPHPEISPDVAFQLAWRWQL